MDLSLTVIIAEISEIRNPDGKQRIYGRGVKIEATMGRGGTEGGRSFLCDQAL